MIHDSLVKAIADAVYLRTPAGRQEFLSAIKDCLGGSTKKVIDSHNTNSAIFVVDNQGQRILIKAEFGKDTATHKEAGWYEHLRATRGAEDSLYLDSVKCDSFALLFLKYIEGALTFDQWIRKYSGKGAELGKMVIAALAYDRMMFEQNPILAGQGDIGAALDRKYQARRREAAAIRYLDELLSERQIVINGRQCLTPDYAIASLMSNAGIRQRLVPRQSGLIHGDLHTGNILIKDGQVHYIDPNGSLNLPLEYDIAKLLHSVHGQYPVIMQRRYRLQRRNTLKFDFVLDRQTPYPVVHQALRDSLDAGEYLSSLYIEALHFVTMLPHHAAKQDETTALFLRSVQLFDDLLKLIGKI